VYLIIVFRIGVILEGFKCGNKQAWIIVINREKIGMIFRLVWVLFIFSTFRLLPRHITDAYSACLSYSTALRFLNK
jgi:hypothetical protein